MSGEARDPAHIKAPPATTAERLWKLLKEMEQERDEALRKLQEKRVVWLLEFDGDWPRQPVLAFETRDSAQAYAAKVAPPGHPGESPSWREHDIDCWTLEGSSYSGEMSIGKVEVFK